MAMRTLARPQAGDKEVRRWSVGGVEMRQAGGSLSLKGYASVFNSPYEMYGGPSAGGWTEVVDPAAFDKTLREKPDVQLLINHEGMPLARTKSGTLRLSTNKVGLQVEADLEPADPDVISLGTKMRRGDIDEMSFAFRTVRQEWDEEYTERRMLELSLHKGDVSVVNYGANPATSATLRRLAHLSGVDPRELVEELRRDGDRDPRATMRSAIAVLQRALGESSGTGISVAAARAELDARTRPARPRTSGGTSLAAARAELRRLGR